MNDENSTYRVEIINSGTPRQESYSWKIYRNMEVLPILRSQQPLPLAWQDWPKPIDQG